MSDSCKTCKFLKYDGGSRFKCLWLTVNNQEWISGHPEDAWCGQFQPTEIKAKPEKPTPLRG